MKLAIYVPGLTSAFNPNYGVEAHAQRLANALEVNTDYRHRYSVKITKEALRGEGSEEFITFANILMNDGESTQVIYRIYEYDYAHDFVMQFHNKNTIKKAWFLCVAMVQRLIGIRPFWGPLLANGDTNSLSKKGRVQMGLMMVVFMFLGIFGLTIAGFSIVAIGALIGYFLVTLVKGIYALVSLLPFLSDGEHNITLKLSETGSLLIEYTSGFSVLPLAAFMYFFFPKFRDELDHLVAYMMSMDRYLNLGENRSAICGKLQKLIDQVLEKEQPDDPSVELHAFSFGTIVTLDTLYPIESPTSHIVKNHVKTLITIGSPYDYIRVYYPHHFLDRKNSSLNLIEWYNVYSEIDIWSSNFREDSRHETGLPVVVGGQCPINIRYDYLSVKAFSKIDYMMLAGFKSHSMFWDKDSTSAMSCYSYLWQVMMAERKKNQITAQAIAS